MKRNYKLERGIVGAVAFFCGITGSVMVSGLMHANETKADGNRVFELRIYHALPGKGPALESVF